MGLRGWEKVTRKGRGYGNRELRVTGNVRMRWGGGYGGQGGDLWVRERVMCGQGEGYEVGIWGPHGEDYGIWKGVCSTQRLLAAARGLEEGRRTL